MFSSRRLKFAACVFQTESLPRFLERSAERFLEGRSFDLVCAYKSIIRIHLRGQIKINLDRVALKIEKVDDCHSAGVKRPAWPITMLSCGRNRSSSERIAGGLCSHRYGSNVPPQGQTLTEAMVMFAPARSPAITVFPRRRKLQRRAKIKTKLHDSI